MDEGEFVIFSYGDELYVGYGMYEEYLGDTATYAEITSAIERLKEQKS